MSGPGLQDPYALVFQQLPDVAAQLTGSPRWRDLAGALGQLQGAGVDVAQFLAAVRPVLLEQARSTPAAQAQAPAPTPTRAPAVSVRRDAVAGGGGLRSAVRRFTDRSGAQARADDLRGLGVTASMEAWAVLAAYCGVGFPRTTELVASPRWPQIVVDMAILGHAGQDPAAVLRRSVDVWAAQQGRGVTGLDWPATAVAGLGHAVHALQPAASPATAPAPSQAHAAGQEQRGAGPGQPTTRSPDTAEVPMESIRAAAATAASTQPPGDLTATFSDAPATTQGAAVARSSGAFPGDGLTVVDNPPPAPLSTGAAPGHAHGRGR